MIGCLDPQALADFSKGRLAAKEAERVAAHLAVCVACRTASTRVKRITDTLQVIAEAPPPITASSTARMEATLRWTRMEPEPTRRTPTDEAPPRRPAFSVAGIASVGVVTVAAAAAIVAIVLHAGWFRRAPRAPAPATVVTRVDPPRPAPAPARGLEAVITLVGGEAHLQRDGLSEAPIEPSETLRTGDHVVTGPGARLAFQWGEGSGALVEGGSDLGLSRLERRAQELTLARGTVAVRVGPHQPGESLRVDSPDHGITVHGTWFVVTAEAHGTQVQVLEGVVEIASRQGDAASTRLVAPSRAFFPRDRGVAEDEQALAGREAAVLRASTEMGLLGGGGGEADALLASTGILPVDCDPPAQIVVDGVSFGQTPLRLRRARDRHLVELTRPGFSTLRRWITVGAETEPLHLALRVEPPKPDSVPAGPEEAQQVVASRRRQVSACYERALKRDPGLAGSVTLELHVGPAGQVLSARVDSDTLGDPQVTECLRRETAGWLFRHARNASVIYPFVFRTP